MSVAFDVGIFVDGAVDVAKDAADMILLERDLDVLYEGIREGRRTFGNILKYIMISGYRFNPLASRPHHLLAGTSLAVVAVAALLPLTPIGATLGFVALPLNFFAILIAMVVVYLMAVEGVKRWFYRRLAGRTAGIPSPI